VVLIFLLFFLRERGRRGKGEGGAGGEMYPADHPAHVCFEVTNVEELGRLVVVRVRRRVVVGVTHSLVPYKPVKSLPFEVF